MKSIAQDLWYKQDLLIKVKSQNEKILLSPQGKKRIANKPLRIWLFDGSWPDYLIQ